MTDSYREDSVKDLRIDLTYVGLIVSQCQTRFSIVVNTANVIKKKLETLTAVLTELCRCHCHRVTESVIVNTIYGPQK